MMQMITGKDIKELEDGFVFIYSTFCGTCHVARSFLDKIESTHKQEIFYKLNASFSEETLQEYKIENVPCLMIIKNCEVKERIYTFYSIGNIYQYLYTYRSELFKETN